MYIPKISLRIDVSEGDSEAALLCEVAQVFLNGSST